METWILIIDLESRMKIKIINHLETDIHLHYEYT